MSARCTICDHPKRKPIDKALAEGSASIRKIAQKFAVSEHALRRHRDKHLIKQAATALVKREREDLIDGRELIGRLKEILDFFRSKWKGSEDENIQLRAADGEAKHIKTFVDILQQVKEMLEQRGLQTEDILQRFLEEKHPELIPEALAYMEESRAHAL